ncbi:hypothetical protein [Vibrio phage RYC]|nr:hypothetical protein [Vibrio phage RYC]
MEYHKICGVTTANDAWGHEYFVAFKIPNPEGKGVIEVCPTLCQGFDFITEEMSPCEVVDWAKECVGNYLEVSGLEPLHVVYQPTGENLALATHNHVQEKVLLSLEEAFTNTLNSMKDTNIPLDLEDVDTLFNKLKGKLNVN